jgi:ferric iron reductase protein FhuF
MLFFGLTASLQYFLAKDNKLVDFSLKHLDFQAETHHNHLHSAFKWKSIQWDEVPSTSRKQFLTMKLTHFYKETINPVIECAAAAAGVKPQLIWNQFGGRMSFTLDYLLAIEPDQLIKERLSKDHKTLCALDAKVFNLKKIHLSIKLDI